MFASILSHVICVAFITKYCKSKDFGVFLLSDSISTGRFRVFAIRTHSCHILRTAGSERKRESPLVPSCLIRMCDLGHDLKQHYLHTGKIRRATNKGSAILLRIENTGNNIFRQYYNSSLLLLCMQPELVNFQ